MRLEAAKAIDLFRVHVYIQLAHVLAAIGFPNHGGLSRKKWVTFSHRASLATW